MPNLRTLSSPAELTVRAPLPVHSRQAIPFVENTLQNCYIFIFLCCQCLTGLNVPATVCQSLPSAAMQPDFSQGVWRSAKAFLLNSHRLIRKLAKQSSKPGLLCLFCPCSLASPPVLLSPMYPPSLCVCNVPAAVKVCASCLSFLFSSKCARCCCDCLLAY